MTASSPQDDAAPEEPSELGTLARGGGFSVISFGTNAVLSFAFTAAVTRAIPIRSAGAVFQAIALFSIAMNCSTIGAGVGLQRFLPTLRREHPGGLGRIVTYAVVPPVLLSAALGTMLFVLSKPISHALVSTRLQHQTAELLQILAPVLPCMTALMVLASGIAAWSVAQASFIQNTAVPAGRLALLPCFAVIGLSAPTVLAAWSIPVVIGTFIAIGMIVGSIALERPRATLREGNAALVTPGIFWRFALPRTFGNLFGVLVSYLDIVLVGALSSTRNAAGYNVASRFVALGILGLSGIGFAIAPQFSRLLERRAFDKARELYQVSSGWIVMISWPPLILMATFPRFLLHFFGHGYEAASVALTLLSLAMLANTASGNSVIALLMSGRSTANLVITGIGLAINLALNFLLIPHIASTGAAIAWSATIIFTVVSTGLFLYRTTTLQPLSLHVVTAIAVSLVSCAIPALVALAVLGNGPRGFIAALVGSVVLYLMGALVTRRVLQLDLLLSMLRPRARPASWS